MIKPIIIYEDNHLLVVEKPVNMLSQSDSTNDLDLLTVLKQDLKERYSKPGNVYLGLVHRLDRPVGGVMVFAKTSKATSRLSESIRKREFKKKYLAIVNSVPLKLQDTLIHYLLKDNSTNTVSVVDKNKAGAKEAILDYKVLKSNKNYSLVEINLHTGRSHQIRVQFAAIGTPLYGDKKYNLNSENKEKQIALWSSQIEMEHPTTKEKMIFNSTPLSVYPWNLFF